jgi:2-oxoisovalerate dehydrogenase E1 component
MSATNRRERGLQRMATTISTELKLKFLKLMLNSRLNDEGEQALKRRGQGHFQMSSEGHEALAAVAFAMHPEDWLHPHYRDRAIVLGRGVTHEQFFLDFFSKEGGPSNGRQMPVHYNSRALRIVSLSSPVATNMLQAVGMAMSLKERKIPEVVVTSIGDAATREGESLEAIAQAVVDNLPIVFLIEDNRYGISTCTEGKTFWTIPHSLANGDGSTQWFHGCRVEIVDGLDPVTVYEAARDAIERARSGKGPTCLVTKLERLKSHSSSDDQRMYRSPEELKSLESKDPVKRYIERCIKEKITTPVEVDELRASIKADIEAAITRAKSAPEPDPESAKVSALADLPPGLPKSDQHLPKPLAKKSGGMTMAQCIDLVLEQEMRANPRVCLYGEDIEDPKGDVFGTTRGLSRQFPGRVKNSPLAEATILGSAVGRALLGDLPVSAIQFVDFMGPGLNQLFNEVLTMHWRSLGQWNCPMVIMAPYGAYLPGLGPWHSQTNEAIYAHLPGMHIAIPSNPGDAAGLLRYALRCNRPVLFLYPKALLHGAEDTVVEPGNDCIVPFGKARIVQEGADLTIATWGNCVSLCTAAAEKAAGDGMSVEIIDLRSVNPWDVQTVMNSVKKTGRLLVVHEDAKTCGVGAEVIAEVVNEGFQYLRAVPTRITKSDDHNPYNYELELAILPSVEGIAKSIQELCRQNLKTTQHAASAGGGSSAAAVAKGGAGAMGAMGMGATGRAASPVAANQAASAAVSGTGTKMIDVEVPRQSPTDEDATLVRYHVKVGQKVKTGEPLAEMEANKGSFDLESTHDGVVSKLIAKEGERVHVETALLTLEVGSGGHGPAPKAVEKVRELKLSPAQIQVGALALKSQLEIPTVDVECEADVTDLVKQRETLKDEFVKRYKLKPTYTHFILWAMLEALRNPAHEGFRGRLSPAGDALLIESHINVGFAAVGPEENLYSPVVKQAEAMTFPNFAKRVQELTEKVRAGSINSADLQGASITLTNIGAFEATRGTPFIIPGQLGMLTAGSILERPRVVAEGKGSRVEPRSLINLKLVFDHRPFNGSHAANFLRAIRQNLEKMDLKKLLA